MTAIDYASLAVAVIATAILLAMAIDATIGAV